MTHFWQGLLAGEWLISGGRAVRRECCTAYAIQIALALMLATRLARLWQSEAAFELKGARLPPKPARHAVLLNYGLVFALQDDRVGNFSPSLHCGRGFRPFRSAGPCEAGARASLFSRLAE
jgi:hypothetical protein